MIHQQRFLEAVKISGVKTVAIIDDAFDPPPLTNSNSGPVLDYLENADTIAVLVSCGVTTAELDAASVSIAQSDFESDEVVALMSKIYSLYIDELDGRFDPGGIFSSDKASNLSYVRPLVALLKKCDPPLKLAILGAGDGSVATIADSADLIFLDFYLNRAIPVGEEGTAGQRRDGRAASLEKIKDLIKKRADRAPSIVLMSSHSDVAKQAESFRKDIGKGLVYASRFTHLEKKQVRFTEDYVEIDADAADALLDIVQTYEFGRALDVTFEAWLSSAAEAVSDIRTDAEQLNLKELAYLVRFRLAAEGQGLLEYLEWFFGECLLNRVAHRFDDAVNANDDIKIVEGGAATMIEGAFDGPTKKIAELYHQVRIQSPRSRPPANYRLGDLYLVTDDAKRKKVAAIITPDCDLITRSNGKRATNRLLMVTGTYRKFDSADVTVSDFVMIGDKAYNVSWNTKEIHSRDFNGWPPPGQSAEGIEYLGTLRTEYAQVLQKSVLDDLGRIGVTVAPSLGMSAAAKVTVKEKSGKTANVELTGLPSAYAYLVPGRNTTDKPKVVFTRKFVSALIEALAKLDPTVYSNVQQLQRPEAYHKLKKMFQEGIRLEDSIDLGIAVTANKKAAGESWCWITMTLEES